MKIKRCYTNLKIKKKLLMMSLTITVVIIIITSLSLYIIASNTIIGQTQKQFTGIIDELSESYDHYFKIIETSFDYIANNEIVQEELKSDDPCTSNGEQGYSYYSRAGQIRRLLLQGYSSVYMTDIELCGYNGADHILDNDNTYNRKNQQTVTETAEGANGRFVFINDPQDKEIISAAKQIKDLLTARPLGILSASIKKNYLEDIADMAMQSFQSDIILLDKNNQQIISTVTGPEEGIHGLITQITGRKGNFFTTVNSEKYCCVYCRSQETGFTLIGFAPMSVLRKTASTLRMVVILLIIFGTILCIILSDVLARGISGPIEETVYALNKFAKGDFSVRLPENRKDEIGEMNLVFNNTIVEVQSLLKKIVEMETANKDIEFQALQAQINPHFLYNVLDTVNWMARKKGEDKICNMVTSLSNIMRGSISNKKSMVTIRDEMKYVSDYIYIQETRYGDKFVSCIDVDDRLNNIMIPKMTIQTLVENAIVHGIEGATWNCMLEVSGEMDGDRAIITVCDDGAGMTEEKLQELMMQKEAKERTPTNTSQTHTNLGIYAVRRRLEYVYDGKALFDIRSETGKGTEVRIVIPYKENRRYLEDEKPGDDTR